MKKKLIPMILAVACVAAVGLSACGGGGKSEAYYNNTYTLTGKGIIDWTTKAFADNYKQTSGKYTQRKILEMYWDEIDWDYTIERAGNFGSQIQHNSVDALIASYNAYAEICYAQAAGLKLAISGKGDMTLTLTLPANWMEEELVSDYYEQEITMPFFESRAALAEDLPYEGFDVENVWLEAGYYGLGVYKTEVGHVLMVKFSVSAYTNDIAIHIQDYVLTGDSENPVDWQNSPVWFETDLYPHALQPMHVEQISASEMWATPVLPTAMYTGFTVTKNK